MSKRCDVHDGAQDACGQCLRSTEQHLKNARAEVERLRAALVLARDWSEPFRNAPTMTKEQFHDRMCAALAEVTP
jgi:hypothetical protein